MNGGVLSLTKHYVLERLVREIARVRPGMTPDEVRGILQKSHTELYDDLFVYDEMGVVDSVLMEVCRSGSPGAIRVVWVALVAADTRLQRVIKELLVSRHGKLRPEAFSADQLERFLEGRTSRKQATNILRYFEKARIVVPTRHRNTIVGINRELDTRSAVPLVVAYLAERYDWDDPLRSASRLGANAWLNLRPAEFSAAFEVPSNAETEDVTAAGQVVAGIAPEAERPDLEHPYREEDESAGLRFSGVREFDTDVMERASLSHRVLQNKLARWLREHDLVPISPTGPPRFDVGWWSADVFWIAEVKSLRVQNESHQIRLGLGQVLDYLHQLAERGVNARGVLAVEAQPTGGHWPALCAQHGVVLTWPPFVAMASV